MRTSVVNARLSIQEVKVLCKCIGGEVAPRSAVCGEQWKCSVLLNPHCNVVRQFLLQPAVEVNGASMLVFDSMCCKENLAANTAAFVKHIPKCQSCNFAHTQTCCHRHHQHRPVALSVWLSCCVIQNCLQF